MAQDAGREFGLQLVAADVDAAAVDGEARPGSDLDDLQVLVVLPEESGHERRVAEVHPERRRGARSQRWRARCLHQEISP